MAYLDIRTVLEQLSDVLLEISDGNEGNLFDAVAFYWSTDVKEALNDLYHYSGTMALIIPNDLEHSSIADPVSVEVSRKINIDICFCSRSFTTTKSKAANYVGMKKQTDGTWDINTAEMGMLDIALAVVDKLAGKTFGGWMSPITPNRAVPINLADKSGVRPSFLINFTLQMGRQDYTIL